MRAWSVPGFACRSSQIKSSTLPSNTANAFAVLLGRVLDLICDDRQAKPGTLHARITELSDRRDSPPNLVDLAHHLRKLRNFGAHADLGSLSAEDAQLLEALCRAMLLYLYTAPSLVAKAEAKLATMTAN